MQMPQPGEVFHGSYRIDAVLGAGGFATVYRAAEDSMSRAVALKVLKPSHGAYTREMVARFEREVAILARLVDPHTVRMYDCGKTASGLLFMVFELVEGKDLSALLREVGRLDAGAVRHVLRQVLFSLREAHAADLLHRDIKPENIRVFEYMGDPLRVKLLDFGIARPSRPDGDAQITKRGELVGTPRYMSPEQLRFQDLTPASDIYSLGIVAYEMLMGVDAMHGNRISDQVDRVAFANAFRLPDDVDASLRAVIAKMVARDATDRYTNVDDVLRDLGVEVAVPGAANISQTRPAALPLDEDTTKRRSPVSMLTLVLAALGAAAVVIVLLVLLSPDERSEPEIPATIIAPSVRTERPAVVVDAVRVHDAGQRDAAGDVAVGAVADAGSAEFDMLRDRSVVRSSGCGTKRPYHKTEERGVGDLKVVAWLPPDYDPDVAHPILMLVHNVGQTPREMFDESNLIDVAQAAGMVVVAPRLRWDSFTEQHAMLASDYLDVIDHEVCFDRNRIFAVGEGNGAAFVKALPCALPGVVAIATVSHHGAAGACDKAVPHMYWYGQRHQRLSGFACESYEPASNAVVESWKERNRCTGARASLDAPSIKGCETWSCAAPFVHCVHDGGRGWSGTQQRSVGPVSSPCDGPPPDRDLAREIGRFFAAQTR